MINGTPYGRVESEIKMPIATLQLAHIAISEPMERITCVKDSFWLDYSLTPRLTESRFRYSDHWAPHRFEKAGQLFFVPPNEPLHVRSGVGTQKNLFCYLHLEELQRYLDTEVQWTSQRFEDCLDISNLAMRSLLAQIAHEMANPSFASAVMIETLSIQTAIALLRHQQTLEEPKHTGGLSPWRTRLIDERLSECEDLPSLGDLANLCRLSVRQLSRSFKASRGISLGDYIAHKRIENARKRLTDGESVKTVAYAMGFSSPSSFCYAFRKATGCSPGQFRKETLHS